MGFFKKVFKPVRKIAKKIIPKEIRPFLPYIAAVTPGLQGFAAAGGITNVAAQKALIAGLTAAATDDDANILRTAALAGGPDLLSQGLGSAGRVLGDANPESKFAQYLVSKGTGLEATLNNPGLNMGTAKVVGTQAAIDQSAKFAEIRQDEIDAYNKSLQEQGVLDKTKRRTSILNIYLNAGYEPEYVNSMLDRYGYDKGGLAKLRKQYDALMSKMRAPETVAKTSAKLRIKPEDDDTMIPPKKPKDPEDEEEPVLVKDIDKDLAGGLMAAARGVEQAFGMPFSGGEPVPMLRFARGGEVEIEEETDDLGIIDFMRDQGIEYGEQASNMQNDEILQNLYEEFLDLGFSPEDAAKKARQAFDEMSQRPNEGIMQMASGYKTDIEEMYEQYVFEMEEMGLQPMSFSQFEARERAGMADGGRIGFAGGGNGYKDYLQDLKDGIISPDTTFNEWLDNNAPDPDYDKVYAQGGRIDGGIMEKDMRGGGFIPEGTKERADDVPARLSKNEFVMTADAVRAAGGGSVNKGAKRMYDMMYNLEGKV